MNATAPRAAADSALEPAPLLALEEAAARVAAWRAAGRTVVLTNGCFDLLHVGHLRYLAAARALGDALVVAVNDDDSVRALKGPGRPITPVAERAALLGALRVVDAVVVFGGRTAEAVAARLAPEVYAKGGDYDAAANRPPEADVVEAQGGRVVFVGLVPGRSTRAIVERLRDEA